MSNIGWIQAFLLLSIAIEWCRLLPFIKTYLGPDYFPLSPLNSTVKVFGVVFLVFSFLAGCLFSETRFFCLIGLWVVYRIFFIGNRFQSLSRGGGAGVFMTYHTLFFLILYESIYFFDLSGWSMSHLENVYRWDIGVIFLCAGLAKGFSGYLSGAGVEVALANPMWSRFPVFFRSQRFLRSWDKLLNQLGCVTESLAGLLMFFPQTMLIGAVLGQAIFLFVFLVLKLSTLPLLMMILPFIFYPDVGIDIFDMSTRTLASERGWGDGLFLATIYSYFFLMVSLKVFLYIRFFTKIPISKNVDTFLFRLSVFIPVFIWRVFTKDVVNTYVKVQSTTSSGEKKSLFGEAAGSVAYRFNTPAEMVTLSTLFNRIKYDKGVSEEFKELLLRYSRSLEYSESASLRYDFIKIEKVGIEFKDILLCSLDVTGGCVQIVEGSLAPESEFEITMNVDRQK